MKNIIPFLMVIAFLLLSGNVFAYAPIIGNIPDIWIGDEDDNVGLTVDLNFFRFTAAFNFDDYVAFAPDDPNPVTTDVRWSFIADSLDLLLINGKESITDPYTEALEPGLKELTDRTDNSPIPRASSWADFWDILDSPPLSGPPWPDPVPGYELDTIITIFASNGTRYSCKDVFVRANDGGYDPPPPPPPHFYIYDSPGTQWAKADLGEDGTFFTSIGGTPVYVARHANYYGTAAAGPATGRESNWFYAIWDAPRTDIPYSPGYVYRIKYTLRSSQTDVTRVPNTRLLTEFVGTGILAFSGGNRVGRGLFAPGLVARTYYCYVEPPANLADGGVTHVKPRFEVIAFNNNEIGATNYLDEVIIERFATPSKAAGILIQSYNLTAGWPGWMGSSISAPGFAPATVGSNSTGLYIETPGPVTSGAINYGTWARYADGSPVSFEADRLYRCVYTLQSSVSTLGQIRCLNMNKGTDWISKIVIIPNQTQVHMPDADGTEYSNWFETMPEFYTTDTTLNNMSFNCDIADGQASQWGRLYITSVELYYYYIP
jgi:hypothetical protein